MTIEANASFAADLRTLAALIEAHPEMDLIDVFDEFEMNCYGKCNTVEAALQVLSSLPSPRIGNSGNISIEYIIQEFGCIKLKYIAKADAIRLPVIVDDKITWQIRPEFAPWIDREVTK